MFKKIASFFTEFNSFRSFCVSSIFAINFLDKTDSTVDSTKAVNTLIFHDKKFIEGKNTDVLGFKTSLKESMKTTTKEKAIIIGNGGAARAILYSLITLKYKQIVICARKRTKSEQLRKDMEKLQFKNSKTVIILKNIENIEEETEETNLLVNTTPLGMKGYPDIFFSFDKLNKNALVFDVVYNPLETNLLKQTRKRGNKTINGLRMLLYQAQGGFKAWFHKKPKITKELENFDIPDLIDKLKNRYLEKKYNISNVDSFWLITSSILNKNLDLFNNISNVKIIDPLDKLLQDKNNFIDYLHLTPQGNNILASEIFKVINKNL